MSTVRYQINWLALLGYAALASCAWLPQANDSSQREIFARQDALPRVEPIALEMLSQRQREVLGIIDGEPIPRRAMVNLHRILIYNPELMAAYYPLGDRLLRNSELSVRDKELLILRAVWLYQDRWEWVRHYPKALAAGWSEQAVDQIKRGGHSAYWSGSEAALLKAVDAIVIDAVIGDDQWQELSTFYSVPEILTIVTTVTHFHWVATMTKSFRLDPGSEPIQFD